MEKLVEGSLLNNFFSGQILRILFTGLKQFFVLKMVQNQAIILYMTKITNYIKIKVSKPL